MTKRDAIGFGFIAASAVPALAIALLFHLSDELSVRSFLGTFFIAYLYSAGAACCLGVPLFLAMNRLRIVTWWSTLIAGIVIGVATALIIQFPSTLSVRSILLNGSYGVASATVFWSIYRLGR